jgi:hypothetical protein
MLNYGELEGETGRKGSFPFNRVIGSTLAGDRIDFSSLAPRSIFFNLPTIPHKVEVNLATGSAVLGSGTWAGSTGSWGFQVQNFEDVTGSHFDDILIGNADSNKIFGGAGNDTLDGDAGVDVLTGGSGNDRFILADRGDLNADSITDFKAYMVRSQPEVTLPEFPTSGGVILSGDSGGIFTGRPPGGVILKDYIAIEDRGDLNADSITDFKAYMVRSQLDVTLPSGNFPEFPREIPPEWIPPTGTPTTDLTIEDQGNTKLFRGSDGQAFVETGAGRRQEITAPWGISATSSDNNEWQMLAAETIGDNNQILWRNNTSNFLHTWSLDANWTWQSSSGADPFNTPRAWELETIFQVDGNRDGITGAPFTTLEAQGDTKLLSRGDGKAFVEYGAGMRQEISSPWNSPVGNDSSEWQMVAAEMIAGTNQILWRNNTSNFLHTWSLDAIWTWQSSSGADGFNTPRAWELETNFQVDGNHDGIIGAPGSRVAEDDALILADHLDDGLVGASAAGIKGLTFSGGNEVGNTLAPTSFFKGAGMNGASFGAAAGIFVNTSSGDVFYNDDGNAGSYLIARLGAAGVAGISASDFLLG